MTGGGEGGEEGREGGEGRRGGGEEGRGGGEGGMVIINLAKQQHPTLTGTVYMYRCVLQTR